MSLPRRVYVALAALLLSCVVAPAGAQDKPLDWRGEKCARYTKAWSEALKRKGPQGLGREFLERHDAFLASGCTEAVAVCPRSDDELTMANILVLAALNGGLPSTFLPFSCRK